MLFNDDNQLFILCIIVNQQLTGCKAPVKEVLLFITSQVTVAYLSQTNKQPDYSEKTNKTRIR